MKGFFKTIGLGILYFLLSPFLLLYLVLYMVYLFLRMPLYFIQRLSSKKKVDEMEKKASTILDSNRYSQKPVEPTKQETIIEKEGGEKVVYNTTNIYVTSPEQLDRTQQYIESHKDQFVNPNQDSYKGLQQHLNNQNDYYEQPLIEEKPEYQEEVKPTIKQQSNYDDSDTVENSKREDYFGPHSLKRKDD